MINITIYLADEITNLNVQRKRTEGEGRQGKDKSERATEGPPPESQGFATSLQHQAGGC